MPGLIKIKRTQAKSSRNSWWFSPNSARAFTRCLVGLVMVSWGFPQPVQTWNHSFHIFLGEKEIGYLNFSETRWGKDLQILVESEIDARFIFKYTAKGEEIYQYRNDTLISSNLFRQINGKVRLNQKIIRTKNGYKITGPQLAKNIESKGVRTNLTRLFVEEPVGIQAIFSDRFGEWVPLEQTGEHQYKITLPNGSRTHFSYRNGRCQSVVSIDFFYKVRLIPKP